MLVTTKGCDLELNRGPDWLFVRLQNFDPDGLENEVLAERIWSLLEKHLTYRVVLELDDVELLRSILIAQLVLLQRRVLKHRGVIRLSGLSPHNREVLETCRLEDRLPAYEDRVEAVMGTAPIHPR
jgi:anti-anti-sigma factor